MSRATWSQYSTATAQTGYKNLCFNEIALFRTAERQPPRPVELIIISPQLAPPSPHHHFPFALPPQLF